MNKLLMFLMALAVGFGLAYAVSAKSPEVTQPGIPSFQSLGASGGYKDVVWVLEEGRYLRFCESNRVVANWGIDCSNALDLVTKKLVPDSSYPKWPQMKEPVAIPRE